MPITLTTPFVFPNGARLTVEIVRLDEEAETMIVTVAMRTPNATNHITGQRMLWVRNGKCDQLTRGALVAHSTFDQALQVASDALTLPTGYTDAVNAWRAAATAGNRRAALETWMLSTGVIHASLTGT